MAAIAAYAGCPGLICAGSRVEGNRERGAAVVDRLGHFQRSAPSRVLRNGKGPAFLQALDCLARPAGFEPTTPWFVARYSNPTELRARGPNYSSLVQEVGHRRAFRARGSCAGPFNAPPRRRSARAFNNHATPSQTPRTAAGQATTCGHRAAMTARARIVAPIFASKPDSAESRTRRPVSAAPSALPTLTAPCRGAPGAARHRAPRHARGLRAFNTPDTISAGKDDLGRAHEIGFELRSHPLCELRVLDRDIELVIAHPTRDVEIGRSDPRPEPVGDRALRMQHRSVPFEDAHACLQQRSVARAGERRQRRNVACSGDKQPNVDPVARRRRQSLHVRGGADKIGVSQPQLPSREGRNGQIEPIGPGCVRSARDHAQARVALRSDGRV